MLFRYKITERAYENLEQAFYGPGVCYRVTIQYYKPNAKLFQWRYFNTNTLCGVLNKIGHVIDNIETNDGLLNALQEYNNIGEIMFKYIKALMADNDYKQHQKDLEDKIDSFVLTNDWHTIEIKENE